MAKTTPTAEIQTGLETYVAALQALMTAIEAGETSSNTKIICEIRQKYAKIITERFGSQSSYSYVDLATGDVVKGNWKGPERAVLHIKRGNILDGSWLDWHGQYGLGYADESGYGRGRFRALLTDAAYEGAKGLILDRRSDDAAKLLSDAIAHTREGALNE